MPGFAKCKTISRGLFGNGAATARDGRPDVRCHGQQAENMVIGLPPRNQAAHHPAVGRDRFGFLLGAVQLVHEAAPSTRRRRIIDRSLPPGRTNEQRARATRSGSAHVRSQSLRASSVGHVRFAAPFQLCGCRGRCRGDPSEVATSQRRGAVPCMRPSAEPQDAPTTLSAESRIGSLRGRPSSTLRRRSPMPSPSPRFQAASRGDPQVNGFCYHPL